MMTQVETQRERQKVSHVKVRTGCVVCKTRRVKCDETKPTCVRCRVGNRKCVYAVPKTWEFKPEKQTPTTLKPPPALLPVKSEEARAFEYFKQNTAPQFAGHHEIAKKFWGISIPQNAHNDPLIFSLSVAMGARHEATLVGSPSSLELATKSHTAVLSTMAHTLSKMDVQTVLLCCGMLMGYANLCEEIPATAVIHLNLGLKMLREAAESDNSFSNDSRNAYIGPMFAELELGTAIFAVPSTPVKIHSTPSQGLPTIPSAFDDLYQAKHLLFDLLSWLLYVMVLYKDSYLDLKAKMSEIDELLVVWRYTLVKYGESIAAIYPGLFLKVRKMLFQYKLFHMCKEAARNKIFQHISRMRMTSIDFPEPHVLSVECSVDDNVIKKCWSTGSRPTRREYEDDLDIWPMSESLGTHDGIELKRIVLGR